MSGCVELQTERLQTTPTLNPIPPSAQPSLSPISHRPAFLFSLFNIILLTSVLIEVNLLARNSSTSLSSSGERTCERENPYRDINGPTTSLGMHPNVMLGSS